MTHYDFGNDKYKMVKKTQHILIADYVPLANKGEEAIVRGIEDMISEKPVKIGLFDKTEEVLSKGNITIFPVDWIFGSLDKNSSRYMGHLKNIYICFQMKFGYYSKLKNMTYSKAEKYHLLREFFDKADYVLVGHNGFFKTESCGIINLAKKAGKRVGILGSGTGISKGQKFYLRRLYSRAMEESDFCIFRECYSYESMKSISNLPDKLRLEPDPAFYMRPANSDEAIKVLNSCGGYVRARAEGKKIVAVTVREKGIPYQYSFVKYKASEKFHAHARFIAGVLDFLIKERNVFILFLPHAIEKDSSDVEVAERVCRLMSASEDSYGILKKDLDARVLKSIISECNFLIGERAHSIIGSVSVGTPFVAFTNRKDYRTHGIIGKMCNCEDMIIDIAAPEIEAVFSDVLRLFDKRQKIAENLQNTSKILSERLVKVANLVKGI